MYTNADAIIRPELTSVVEEAAMADAYFIGLKVLPILPVDKHTGEFRRITIKESELLKTGVTTRAEKAGYGQIDRTFVKDSYLCVDRGLEEDIDDAAARKVADSFDMESVSAKGLLSRIMRDHEVRAKDRLFNTDVNAGGFAAVNSTVAYTLANKATIDFAEDIQKAIKRVKQAGELVNTMVLNRDVFDRIRTSDLFAKFLFGPLGGGQQITEDMLGKAFGNISVLVADAVADTSGKGLDPVIGYIWPTSHIWIGNVQGGDLSAGGAGRTMVWTGDTGGSSFVTETYRKEHIRSDTVRVRTNTDEKIVNQKSGTLITTQWA